MLNFSFQRLRQFQTLLLFACFLALPFVIAGPFPTFAETSPLADFNATTISGAYQIQLSWTGAATVSRVEIQRSSNSVSAWETWGEATNTPFVDTEVACSHTYYYRARAFDMDVNPGPWSEVTSATAAPCAPIAVSVYSVPGWYILEVHWVDIAPDETTVRLQRSDDTLVWRELAELPPGAVSYTDRFGTRDCSTSRNYRLRSEREGIFSPYSTVQSGTTSPCAPTSTWAELIDEGQHVRLHWRDNAPDETSFEIWRYSDTQPASRRIDSVSSLAGAGNWGIWDDLTAICHDRNYYRIRALRGEQSSSPWAPPPSGQLMIYLPTCAADTPTPTLTPNPTSSPIPTATPTVTPPARSLYLPLLEFK